MLIAWRARRYAARTGLGEVRGIFRPRVSWLNLLIFVPVTLIYVYATFVTSTMWSHSWVNLLVASSLPALFMWILVVASSDALVIADRGILIGSFSHLLSPYAMRWEDIDLTTVCFFSKMARIKKVYNFSGASNVRADATQGDVFSFYGLDPEEARIPGSFGRPLRPLGPSSGILGRLAFVLRMPFLTLLNMGTGDPMWMIPVSKRRQRELAQLIASIIGPPMDEKILYWMSEPIELSKETRIAARQLSRERKY